ncbi:hypothetical protein [Sediminibacterium soli]|uniref:hypothetical protein n=1 Tax=Sediminibacterium soli TaxID=2698829 RepID=UPI00137A1785|nr:hypothetical protein [Sediminibacterium soli]NCI47434.1 hypothetical protein [Sediminibacterium soli]
MNYKIIMVCLLFSISAAAQDCTKEALLKKPGTWKEGTKGFIQNVNAADLIKEKAVLAGIHKMVFSKYHPTGCEIAYSTVFGKNKSAAGTWIADPYHYAMFVLRYLCDESSADKSKYYTDISTPTTVTIASNEIFSLNNLYASSLAEDDSRGYLKLTKRPEKKDGCYFMGEETIGDRANKIKEYRWLITYNDTLPFSYLSQKEYLLIQRKRLEKDIEDSPGEQKYLEKFISTIDACLKRPEEELKQPAVCLWNEEERFEKFVSEGAPGSFIAVKPNPDYYHKKLPMSSPQFFSVVYKIAHGDPVFEENISNIQKAVDFSVLKNMLGR